MFLNPKIPSQDIQISLFYFNINSISMSTS